METEQHMVARGCGEHDDTVGVYSLVLMETALMVTMRTGWFLVTYKERKL